MATEAIQTSHLFCLLSVIAFNIDDQDQYIANRVLPSAFNANSEGCYKLIQFDCLAESSLRIMSCHALATLSPIECCHYCGFQILWVSVVEIPKTTNEMGNEY